MASLLALLEGEVGDPLDLLFVGVDLLEDVGQQLHQLRILQTDLFGPKEGTGKTL